MYTIVEDINIILLMIRGLFVAKYPTFLVVVGSMLMIWITYSYFDGYTKKNSIIDLSIRLIFSIISFDVIGFAVFYFASYIKKIYLLIISEVTYFVYSMAYVGLSLPLTMINMLVLLAIWLVVSGVRCFVERCSNNNDKIRDSLFFTAIEQLHEKQLNEELRQKKVLDEKNARLMEREKISRNIHNSVGHSITAAVVTLDAADVLYDVDKDEARRKMNDANERIRGSLESIRRAVRVLDDEDKILPISDLKNEFESIINEFVIDTNIVCNFEQNTDEICIPHDCYEFLTGAIKEFFTNGIKHGKADDFVVVFNCDKSNIKLEVSDNGKSDFNKSNQVDKINNGFGIKKIISFVEENAGNVKINNYNGFSIVIDMPIIVND